ncbi:MAG TPA: hypothetical protein VG872_00035 [Acidimicrobiia bacterium]|nr:hypothetical protein [Acidimicrobiia bacterium]
MRRIIPWLLVMTACGMPSQGGGIATTTPPPSTTLPPATSPPSTSAPSELRVIVPPGPDGSLPADLLVGCPNGPSFTLGSLEGMASIAEEMAHAIRPFLESEEGAYWPQEGWVLLEEDGDEALLVHRDEHGYAFMSLVREGGTWSWSGASGTGPCPLQYVVPFGLNTVDWRLDTAAAPPGPESTTVAVLLTERECVSGQEIGDRLVGPQLVMTETALHLAFAAVPPPGDAFDCQGNPETSYTVTLPGPLGERTLVEGLATGLSLDDYLP